MNNRRSALLRHARRAGCDTLVAFEPENVFYMTGFWGEAVAILSGRGATLVLPQLEADRAASESDDCEIVLSDRGGVMADTLKQVRQVRNICTDSTDHTVLRRLRRAAHTVPSREPFYSSRMIKDDREIRTLRRASGVIDEMFSMCQDIMKAGQKETELQAVLMAHAASCGLFDTGYRYTLNPLIVAGGPNGALPHAQATCRKFARGDLVVVDLTLRYRGYVSDATRTFCIGRPSQEARDIYDTVKESQRLGIASVRPGAKASMVDAACRGHIGTCGRAKHFIHATGHGIGLDVHEPPAVSATSDAILQKNMAITVEPGIYIRGRMGVRIEDSLIVRDRPSVLHRFTRDLISV